MGEPFLRQIFVEKQRHEGLQDEKDILAKEYQCRRYFIQKDNLSPSYILRMLETSFEKGYGQARRKEFRVLILDEISNNIKNI